MTNANLTKKERGVMNIPSKIICYILYNANFHNSVIMVQKKYLKAMSEQLPETEIIALVPDGLPELGKVFEDLDDRIKVDYYQTKKLKEVGYLIPEDLVKHLARYDAARSLLLSFHPPITTQLIAGRDVLKYVTTKAVNNYIANFSDHYSRIQRELTYFSMVQYPTIFNSNASRKRFFDDAGKRYLPSTIKANTYETINLGIDIDAIGSHQTTKHDVFTFIFPGNQLLSFKHFEKQLSIFDTAYSAGNMFKVKMFLLPSYVDNVPKREYLEVGESLPQYEFHEEASKCHAFICTSSDESYGLSYLELLQLGLHGIFLKQKWNQDIYDGTGIKLFDSVTDIKYYVNSILKGGELAQQDISFIAKDHDEKVLQKRYVEELVRMYNIQKGR